MTSLRRLARFLWDFVIGDDWRIAVVVVCALGIAALIGPSGWFVLPPIVLIALALSVLEVAHRRRRDL